MNEEMKMIVKGILEKASDYYYDAKSEWNEDMRISAEDNYETHIPSKLIVDKRKWLEGMEDMLCYIEELFDEYR